MKIKVKKIILKYKYILKNRKKKLTQSQIIKLYNPFMLCKT